jgi:urease accessory protein
MSARLSRVAELASASRGTSEFALESSQQAAACLLTLRQVWPDRILDSLYEMLCEYQVFRWMTGWTPSEYRREFK